MFLGIVPPDKCDQYSPLNEFWSGGLGMYLLWLTSIFRGAQLTKSRNSINRMSFSLTILRKTVSVARLARMVAGPTTEITTLECAIRVLHVANFFSVGCMWFCTYLNVF